jgi:hypothetical protein
MPFFPRWCAEWRWREGASLTGKQQLRHGFFSWQQIDTQEQAMAKGYPSRKRTRKAFERGVKTAKTGKGFNPYRHPILKELFERGRGRGGSAAGLGGAMPRGSAAAAAGTTTPRAPTPPDPSEAAWNRAVRASQRRRI